jgi:hypothetical protein
MIPGQPNTKRSPAVSRWRILALVVALVITASSNDILCMRLAKLSAAGVHVSFVFYLVPLVLGAVCFAVLTFCFHRTNGKQLLGLSMRSQIVLRILIMITLMTLFQFIVDRL